MSFASHEREPEVLIDPATPPHVLGEVLPLVLRSCDDRESGFAKRSVTLP